MSGVTEAMLGGAAMNTSVPSLAMVCSTNKNSHFGLTYTLPRFSTLTPTMKQKKSHSNLRPFSGIASCILKNGKNFSQDPPYHLFNALFP